MPKKIKVKKLDSLTEKTLGLMFKSKPDVVLIKTRFGIHTFFLKYPIDVIILDENCVIRKLKKSLEPNRLFFWDPRFSNIIEASSGTIKKKEFSVGDKVELNYIN